MRYVSEILFEHMKIGMLLCDRNVGLTSEEIDVFSQLLNIPASVTSSALKDLVAHGIITAKFGDNHQLHYVGTEYGGYFFQKLCSVNKDAASVHNVVRGLIYEADDS